MLVLTRKKSEMIRIGNDIVIKVVRTGRSTVKLGIEAPANVRILRAELEERDDSCVAETEEGETSGLEELSDAPTLGGSAATCVTSQCFHVAS